MNNNVLVIGNGYDVAHGLKTKYEQFIEWVKSFNEDYSSLVIEKDDNFSERLEKNGFIKYFLDYTGQVQGWVDLEHLIKIIVGNFEEFFVYYTDYVNGRNLIPVAYLSNDAQEINIYRMLSCLSRFSIFDKIHSQAGKNFYYLSELYYSKKFGLNKKAIVKLLREQLDDLISLLQIYLNLHLVEMRKELKIKEQLENIKPNYVISFNYTDTYKLYNVKESDVFHVHGSIIENNIVLGFDDTNPDMLDFIYFKKYFQRIQKLTGYVDNKKIIKYENGFPINATIHFYGHSMDNTDGDIIRYLRTMAQSFMIYKYNQEDYEQKVINLIEVFGKEDATEMIQKGFIKFVDCQ